ncbi:MAG: hypothetical protein MZW92_21100 [Comamonadaceae bacterium]|nr:hypothetical protein [Comamonadaceae bacterium]
MRVLVFGAGPAAQVVGQTLMALGPECRDRRLPARPEREASRRCPTGQILRRRPLADRDRPSSSASTRSSSR